MSQENLPTGQDETEAEEGASRALSEQQLVRREKLARLQAEGRDPFAIVTWKQTHHSKEIKEKFIELENQDVSIAGRIMSFRDIGKAAFIDLQDRDGGSRKGRG